MKRKGLLGGIVLALAIIIGVIMLAFCTTRVPAGYVAVQYNMNGGVKDEVLTQGWHLVSPTTKTTLYTSDSQRVERFEDGKSVSFA